MTLCNSAVFAQNHTANTTRNPNAEKDSLSDDQIQIFSRMLNDMVFVEGGLFYMGEGLSSDEFTNHGAVDNKPSHEVVINSFFLARFEVTQDEWVIVMGTNPAHFQGNDLPVENVSWDDCSRFISRLNELTGMMFRMPTEAEWEYAAKGGKYSCGYDFSGSNYVSSVAWYAMNSNNTTHDVGRKRPNELGIYDMSGNVAEWCSDYYDHDYYRYSDRDNPSGPNNGVNKVNRGGSWLMSQPYLLTNVRNVNKPEEKNAAIGLRLAM